MRKLEHLHKNYRFLVKSFLLTAQLVMVQCRRLYK